MPAMVMTEVRQESASSLEHEADYYPGSVTTNRSPTCDEGCARPGVVHNAHEARSGSESDGTC